MLQLGSCVAKLLLVYQLLLRGGWSGRSSPGAGRLSGSPLLRRHRLRNGLNGCSAQGVLRWREQRGRLLLQARTRQAVACLVQPGRQRDCDRQVLRLEQQPTSSGELLRGCGSPAPACGQDSPALQLSTTQAAWGGAEQGVLLRLRHMCTMLYVGSWRALRCIL